MDSSAVRDKGNSVIMCRYTVMETFCSACSWLVMWYGAAQNTRSFRWVVAMSSYCKHNNIKNNSHIDYNNYKTISIIYYRLGKGIKRYYCCFFFKIEDLCLSDKFSPRVSMSKFSGPIPNIFSCKFILITCSVSKPDPVSICTVSGFNGFICAEI